MASKGRGKNVLSQLPSPLRSLLPALQSSSPQNSQTILAGCRFQIEQTELEYARNLEQLIFSAALKSLGRICFVKSCLNPASVAFAKDKGIKCAAFYRPLCGIKRGVPEGFSISEINGQKSLFFRAALRCRQVRLIDLTNILKYGYFQISSKILNAGFRSHDPLINVENGK